MAFDDTYAQDWDSHEYFLGPTNNAYQMDAARIPEETAKIIDDFEDGNLDEYIDTDPPGNTWIVRRGNRLQGEWNLSGRGLITGYNSWLISDRSLPNLPTRGDTIAFNWEARSMTNSEGNAKFFFMWANQNIRPYSTHDHYEFEIEVVSDEVDMEVDVNGNDVSLGDQVVQMENYTPYRTIIHWDPDGSGRTRLQIRELNTGNLICDYWSQPDYQFDDGGIGFYVRHGMNVWIDQIVNIKTTYR